MMRILGVDVGERRVGLAISNPEETMALPAGFLEVRSPEDAARQLSDWIKEEDVHKAVVGIPYVSDGSEGTAAKKVRTLLGLLEKILPWKVEFHLWDERLTSFDAGQLLVDAALKHSGKKKKGRVDAVAASLILQGFLDHTRPTDATKLRIRGIL
jgi:putative Holliday junction resolvase